MEDGVGFEPTQTFVPTEVAAPPLNPLEYPPILARRKGLEPLTST